MKPRQLALKPSRRLAYILALVSLFACVLVICLPFSLQYKVLLVSVILLVTAYSIACDALLILPWSCHLLMLNKENDISLVQKNGQNFVVSILPTSLVGPQLTVLNLKIQGRLRTRNIILLTDSADANDARLWRVWLKWGVIT